MAKKKIVPICSRCKKELKEGLLLESHDGPICVDCIVKEEIDNLAMEIEEEE